MNEIPITVVEPKTRAKTQIIAYSKEHAKRIIKSVIEEDNRRIRLDRPIIEEIVNELKEEKEKKDRKWFI